MYIFGTTYTGSVSYELLVCIQLHETVGQIPIQYLRWGDDLKHMKLTVESLPWFGSPDFLHSLMAIYPLSMAQEKPIEILNNVSAEEMLPPLNHAEFIIIKVAGRRPR